MCTPRHAEHDQTTIDPDTPTAEETCSHTANVLALSPGTAPSPHASAPLRSPPRRGCLRAQAITKRSPANTALGYVDTPAVKSLVPTVVTGIVALGYGALRESIGRYRVCVGGESGRC